VTTVLRGDGSHIDGAAQVWAEAQLFVYVSNRRATGLYEQLGWRPQGSPEPHPRTGKPQQRYRLTLAR